ncbi:MAG: hypothetical protein M1814_004346 [Vezdaea aestivalis]|nr:MAG: hypothetical protein M1814_004346 [Vezdaea aestivalis]
MAANSHRMSMYSNASSLPAGRHNASGPQTAQISTTTLLNSLHNAYTSVQPYSLDASTSLVVNTWLSDATTGADGREGGSVDADLGRRAWEHARRRAEDGCVVLASLHPSSPPRLVPFISNLPFSVPSTLFTALNALRPFLYGVTPQNPSAPLHSSLAVNFTLSLAGNLRGASIALSTSGINTKAGLIDLPAERGYRAFDVFYYLLTSASTPAEREFLGLKPASSYQLLQRSGTYDTPAYLPAADDTASADDFRAALKEIGIKGGTQRSLLSVLAGLLKLGDTLGFLVDSEVIEDICEDVAGLLGVEPEVLIRSSSTAERETLISGIYEALVDWVIARANDAITANVRITRDNVSSNDGRVRTPVTEDESDDTVGLSVIEIASLSIAKAAALRCVFDDSTGINAEMREDGVETAAAGSSILREMNNAVAEVEPDLGIMTGHLGKDREFEKDRRDEILEKVGREAEEDAFLKKILFPSPAKGANSGAEARFDLSHSLGSSRVWFQLGMHPTDDSPANLASLPSTTSAWSAGTVSRQLRAWRLPEWANRRNRNQDFTADFEIDEFVSRYRPLGCKEGKDGAESWILERGWSNGEVVVGHERIWMREDAWWEAESMLDRQPGDNGMPGPAGSGYSTPGANASGFFAPPMSGDNLSVYDSTEQLRRQSQLTLGAQSVGPAKSIAPTVPMTVVGDYGLGARGDEKRGDVTYYATELGPNDPELAQPSKIIEQPVPKSRKVWVALVWILTFWIPSPLLRVVGRMKRPDVRMAWREKVVLMMFIFLLNAIVVFYIIEFGRLLCPNYDKAWSTKEVSFHQGDNDFWVSHHGMVYDVSKFWKLQHSDSNIETTTENMQPFAGLNLDDYIVPPLTIACPGLVSDQSIVLQSNNTIALTTGLHTSGPRYQADPTTALNSIDWYGSKFLPRMKQYYKGDLVIDKNVIKSEGQNNNHQWVILFGHVFDLTNYFFTVKKQNDLAAYKFLDPKAEKIIKENPGSDITELWQQQLDFNNGTNNFNCLKNAFYVGRIDFRKTPKCQVNNYVLLTFTIVLCTVILTKFLAALQLGSKRRPAAQDKFVICQVPAYTEGEDQLRKGLDSLTALQYDNKRKLICVICDGMIVGGGNDRPTPKIVLDILGVDPKIDPPALPFKSVGGSSDQLNYGKVYSGLYEYEGNVVPYVVIVKVGKESEQGKSKPGNRGKRDSQILLLNFLNRVHHRSAMSPLELEIFHQINNIIGVDPELYEYVLMVDADTSVKEDSLNRLVASCANDAKIAGICGETSLQNEERSWWTMIQVYEYYISHHLAKAFESLFGSVTCLPGCFCMYRLRTADKGRPLIISDKVLEEYSEGNVDTLHKKNLLSLGEDRYLTTLMTKHFPYMSYKFIPDAYASTAAPETWSVLLSQRRRWINSTIHNLGELVWLKELCGFCCFSMRFVVFIDLFGTIILPATCAYLGYLIYKVATKSGQFPLISIIMIAAVYGLQAVIFIIKRQWQHIGWMIIYIIAFPIYAFVLPIYSFWNQDNFSWGNTRIVIGEKDGKKVVAVNDEGFDVRSIPLQRWDDYAAANNLPGRRGYTEKVFGDNEANYEMDDMRSVYSSVKPASTVLTGFGHNPAYMAPQSPAPFGGPRVMSPGVGSEHHYAATGGMPSSDNLLAMQSPPLGQSARMRASPLGMGSRPASGFDFQRVGAGPDDATIVESVQMCLQEVDLDNVTKKQVRALVEQRLQTELTGERRAFLDRQIDAELANM